MLPLYRNQSVHCYVNQLTGFYMLGTLVVNGLKNKNRNTWVNFRFQKKPFGLQIYEKINKKTNIYWAYQQSFYIFLQCTWSWKNQEFSSKIQANIFVIEYVSKLKNPCLQKTNIWLKFVLELWFITESFKFQYFSSPLAGYERCQTGRGNGGVQN